ncbi:hypothetical protein METBIDRAFT_29909 [Metschnikowia bicuspidata var. bicuspidata NRRL YB-4993]|uniref:Ribosomal RNA-processing protein 7 n=1 Tax=Metschnikowia bicuspidata var. bicuspidata NRRL YB-4993 TaxID=869754 RepID=A0A1A0HHG3_9ASCO|nr:hypothetical protein METBIDRAFT_29909 [Metschnikowia bicuspidata var. bicuspidata NRRL YB-4993]OBA23446.1 hypothetical protein METBIDRAFT_29909 [Metschnikowia bicuspidata var. bicuspidata NRRL YB-4993]
MAGITEIKGFQVLKVRLPEGDGMHYMYFRKHEMKGSPGAQNISGRLLFIFNTPIETSVGVLRKYFQQVAIGATVENYIASPLTDMEEEVYIDLTKFTSDLQYEVADGDTREISVKLPKNCGIITFIDKASFQLAFSALKKLSGDKKSTNWPMPSMGTQFLLGKLKAKVLDPNELAQNVSKALELFNKAEQESREELQKQTQIVDEDGFTLVVGSHTKTKAGMLGKQKLLQAKEQENSKKKLKRKEKDDFYRFQLREKKKAEMNDLLHKFKQDQERVKLMKERKRFRPY